MVWGFNIFLYFFNGHQLPSTNTELTYKVKTEKSGMHRTGNSFFLLVCFPPFHHFVESVQNYMGLFN